MGHVAVVRGVPAIHWCLVGEVGGTMRYRWTLFAETIVTLKNRRQTPEMVFISEARHGEWLDSKSGCSVAALTRIGSISTYV